MSERANLVKGPGFLPVLLLSLVTLMGAEAVCQDNVKPRILILFDTSGSMTFNIDESDTEDGGAPTWGDGSVDAYGSRYCCPGLGESRMRIAKDAMTQMIDSTGDIEFALMKFPQDYDASGTSGFSVQWYRNNQVSGDNDILRYEGLGADAADLVSGTWYDYSDYFLDGTYPDFAEDTYLCEEFPGDTDDYGDKIAEMKAWIDHHEFGVDTATDAESNVVHLPDTSTYESPVSLDFTEQELRADGGTPLGEAVHAAYRYLDAVKAADPVRRCFDIFLIVFILLY